MCAPARAREVLQLETPLDDSDCLAREQRFNALGSKAKVQKRHALAGGGKQRSFLGIAKRTQAQGIPGHDHVAQRVEKHNVVGPVKVAADVAKYVDQLRVVVA